MSDLIQKQAAHAYVPFLDAIRVCACFLVILLHVSAIHFYNLSEYWNIFLFYDSISRMCVPLFFMLSGFLLLDSDISSLSKFYYKRYSRLVIPFGIVCVMYYFTTQYSFFTVGEYIYYILNFYVDYHLWYIYVLTGLYLALPFFIKLIHGESGLKFALLYTAIWLIAFVLLTPALRYFRFEYALLPPVNPIFPNGGMEYLAYELYPNIFINFNLFPFFFGFMGYLLCGWFIKKTYHRYNGPVCLAAGLVFIMATICIMVFTHRYSHALAKANELFFENLSPFVFLQAVSFFILCARLKTTPPLLRDLADKSFWIYLIHLLYLRMLIWVWPLPQNYNAIWAVPLYTIIVFGICYLGAIPLRALELRALSLSRRTAGA